jgi:hypothetical protein
VTEQPPKLDYWHVWTDDDGISHQTRCTLSGFEMASVGGKAAPQWNDDVVGGETNLRICVLPVGWVGDWHQNPKPQWIAVLSGRWFVETMDGTRIELGEGEVSFGGDQNAKPDAQGRLGHRSGTVGDKACTLMVLQLDQHWAGARPGAFN